MANGTDLFLDRLGLAHQRLKHNVGVMLLVKVAVAPSAVRDCPEVMRVLSVAHPEGAPTVVATAIARELSAFIWAIKREVMVSRGA